MPEVGPQELLLIACAVLVVVALIRATSARSKWFKIEW